MPISFCVTNTPHHSFDGLFCLSTSPRDLTLNDVTIVTMLPPLFSIVQRSEQFLFWNKHLGLWQTDKHKLTKGVEGRPIHQVETKAPKAARRQNFIKCTLPGLLGTALQPRVKTPR